MRILIVGDFGGRAQRALAGERDLSARKPTMIDVDNFDRVLARIAPRLELSLRGDRDTTLEFASIDDFHPDTLFRRLPLFQGLRDIRQRMQDPATFAEAAAQFRSQTPRRTDEADAETLARLLGRAPSVALERSDAGAAEQARLQALIREVVAPHIVPGAPSHQALYIDALDAEIAARMRAILQGSEFKALEALWRGVQWLCSGLETDEKLKLYILDATRAELLAHVQAAQENMGSSGLYRLLVEQGAGTAGGEAWSLIVASYDFGLAAQDGALLAYLGAVASHAGGPVLAAARSELIGSPADTAEGWNALRESRLAPWIGLALPRVLLRRPYGKRSDPVESFAFEELEPRRSHEAYLWGNGAIACALLIGRAFSARGWDMEPGDELDLEDLPAHAYDEDGETQLQPCAEVTLTDRAAQAVLDAGLIPLVSIRNRNAVRVMRFQSIAKPTQALRGPWSLTAE